MLRLLRRLAILGLGVWGLTVLAVIVTAELAFQRHTDAESLDRPVDAVIVLGAKVDPDGVLGYSGRRRVVAAVQAMQDGKAEAIIFSGGLVRDTQTRSESDLMRAHAVALGAPAARLYGDSRSRSTFENLRFSFAIAEAEGFDRLAVASDAFHLPRAHVLAWFWGRPEVDLIAARGLAREPLLTRAYLYGREAIAWWFNLYKMVGWEVLGWLGVDEAERGWRIR